MEHITHHGRHVWNNAGQDTWPTRALHGEWLRICGIFLVARADRFIITNRTSREPQKKTEINSWCSGQFASPVRSMIRSTRAATGRRLQDGFWADESQRDTPSPSRCAIQFPCQRVTISIKWHHWHRAERQGRGPDGCRRRSPPARGLASRLI